MNFGAVILCGGKSSRMGTDKALLTIGGKTFLEHICIELSEFDELIISYGSLHKYAEIKYPVVSDIYTGCGPMGGIHTALTVCKSDALLVLSCDMPLFRRELGKYLCSQLKEDKTAVVTAASDGRIHPLCAVYRKAAAVTFEQFLKAGNFRMCDALKCLNVEYARLNETSCMESWLRNVNTPEEYKAISDWEVNIE